MAASFQSKDSLVLGIQLKVQEVCVTLSDSILSNSGAVATIDVKEPIKEVRLALHMDDSLGVVVPVAAASQSISGSSVALTLAHAMAAGDSITLKYVIDESV